MHDINVPNCNINLNNIIIEKENLKLSNIAKTAKFEFTPPEFLFG